MALLKIARMGHPVLSQVAEPIEDPNDPLIRQLILDMIETMEDAPGVGLAAPQVHFPLRLVIFQVPKNRQDEPTPSDEVADEAHEEPLTILINPVIEALSEDMELGREGCLSLPEMSGLVPRFNRIRYTGLGANGERIDRTAEGFHARVVQHECDHLDGILYPMRMESLDSFGYNEEIQKGL